MRYILALLLLLLPSFAQAKDQSVYGRVMEARTIRCGYVIFPPYLEKDPKTGALSGIGYDMFNAMGKLLGLKVEWQEEVQFGEMITSVNAGRVDALCIPIGVTASRGAQADFLKSSYYVTTAMWVREADSRSRADFDVTGIKIASVDGTVFDAFVAQYFPKADVFSLPQSAALSDALMAVATGKADAVIMDTWIGEQFAKANPGKIKRLGSDMFRVDAVAPVVRKGETDFKSMLDVAQDELVLSGELSKIIAKHKLPAGTLYERELPYAMK